MVNRRAFFEIFFYNRENRSREMMEAAESVWRAYMKKYGLGLDAGSDGQPTYDEVREITYLANAAIEMVEKQIAEAEAEEARRKKLQKEAWDLGIFVPVDTATAELEKMVLRELNKQTEEAAEEAAEEAVEEPAEEIPEEVAQEPVEETPAVVTEEAVQEVPEEEPAPEVVEEVVVPQIPKRAAAPVPVSTPTPVPVKPVAIPGVDGALNLWVAEIEQWCQSKGMQCIKTVDEGDCYLHVYQPHKKQVHSVGAWCFPKNTTGAELAAEITKLYAYCEGYAACFAQLIK